MRRLSPLALVLFAVAFSGCAITRSVQVVTAGSTTKAQLLQESVDKLHRAVYWGSLEEASNYTAPEFLLSLFKKLGERTPDTKLVDISVSDMEFDQNDPNIAFVNSSVRFFRNAAYVVESKSKREKWEYRRWDGGWRIVSAEDVKKGDA